MRSATDINFRNAFNLRPYQNKLVHYKTRHGACMKWTDGTAYFAMGVSYGCKMFRISNTECSVIKYVSSVIHQFL